MADSILGPFLEVRSAGSATGAGTALTSAATVVAFPPGTQAVMLQARTFSTAVVTQWALVPYLAILKTTDALAAAANTTDYSSEAQDDSTGTTVTLSSMASTHHLWVGAPMPFGGVLVDINALNTNASVLSGTYYNGTTMADISLTDGTDTTGIAFNVDGAITWTVPTTWTAATLRSIASADVGVPHSGRTWYWVKLAISAAIDAACTLNSVMALPRSSAYANIVAAAPPVQLKVHRGHGGVGGIALKTDAGTAVAMVTVMSGSPFV